jgi:predicted transposase/invertase (TIGR01784 family)
VNYKPTNNVLFLKCFASPENADVLEGFIKDVLGIPVTDVTIENPYNIQQIEERLTYTIVDVLARLEDGTLITLELQVTPQVSFAKRSAYYMSSRFVSGYGDRRTALESSASDTLYSSLRPIYGINICDFNMFEDNDDPLRSFKLFDTTYNVAFPEDLFHISYLQLKKVPHKNQEALKRWISFFKGLEPEDDLPDYIEKAYQVIAYTNLTEKEQKMIDYAEMSREDAKAQLLYARNEGMEQGRAQGIEHGIEQGRIEGIAQGLERGVEQGMERGILQTASRMLAKGMAIGDVQDITGLDADTVKRLCDN